MRTMNYKCDRCGKPLTSRTAVKINSVLQRGNDPSEKKNFDFCNKCFLVVKRRWAAALSMNSEEDENIGEMKKTSGESLKMSDILNGALDKEDTEKSGTEQVTEDSTTKKRGPYRTYNKESETVRISEPKRRGRRPKPVELPEPGEDGMVLGPINAAEKQEFLRLYVDEGLSIEEIAERMHRLVKGVKRAINSMEKSGEMESYRKKLDEERGEQDAAQTAIHNLLYRDEEDEEDMSESNTGSGATNSGIKRDSYTGKAQTTVYDGKKYDVGGIMALYKAGWKTADIASERNYDEDVVRLIIEEYYHGR